MKRNMKQLSEKKVWIRFVDEYCLVQLCLDRGLCLFDDRAYRLDRVVWRHELSAPLHTTSRGDNKREPTARRNWSLSSAVGPSTGLRSTARSECPCRSCATWASASRPCTRLSEKLLTTVFVTEVEHVLQQYVVKQARFLSLKNDLSFFVQKF